MQTRHDIPTDDNGKQNNALAMLVRLLARQAARGGISASPSSTLPASDSTGPDSIPSFNDKGGRHDG